MLPDLLYQRLDELGIDFAVLYPTFGLTVMALHDDELRCALARALNRYYAEVYAGYRDRLEPVGAIPTFTPDEAIAELEYATGELGLKGFLFGGPVPRPYPDPPADPAAGSTGWASTAPTTTTRCGSAAWSSASPRPSTPPAGLGQPHVADQHVAQPHRQLRRRRRGGVPVAVLRRGAMRFPELRFAFLEGGVAWAATCSPTSSATARSATATPSTTTTPPTSTARAAAALREHADAASRDGWTGSTRTCGSSPTPTRCRRTSTMSGDRCSAAVEDIVRIFTRQCFFGCEADDPMNALAFDCRINPGGDASRRVRLRHRALGRPRHPRRPARGLGAGRATGTSTRISSGTSCSPTRCASAPAPTPSSSAGPSWPTRSPPSSPRCCAVRRPRRRPWSRGTPRTLPGPSPGRHRSACSRRTARRRRNRGRR